MFCERMLHILFGTGDMSIPIEKVVHNRYQILASIGEGGMSSVYKVYDQILHKNWALKIVKSDATIIEKQAFQHEILLLSKLKEKWFPYVIDSFYYQDRQCVIMEYVEGHTLMDHLRMNISELIPILIELCKMLQCLHEQKPNAIIYIDLKPQNIMLDSNNQVRLLDFGSCCELNGKDKAKSATPRLCAQ